MTNTPTSYELCKAYFIPGDLRRIQESGLTDVSDNINELETRYSNQL